MLLQRILIITGILLSTCYIIVNLIFHREEFATSNEFIVKIQQFGGIPLVIISLLLTYIGFPLIPCYPAIPFIFGREKWIAYKCTFLFSISGYIIGVLKLLYASPRPWWVHDQIRGYHECIAVDFGRPSGHAFIGLYSTLLLYKCYIYDDQSKSYGERIVTKTIDLEDPDLDPVHNDVRDNDNYLSVSLYPSNKRKLIKRSSLAEPLEAQWTPRKILWLIIALILTVLIGFSRIYLGAHTYEQILLGWAYGEIFYLSTVYMVEKYVDKLFLYLYDGRHKQHLLRNLIIVLFFYGVCLAIPLILISIDEASGRIKQRWIHKVVAECGGSHNRIQAISLFLCATIAIPFGIIVGLMFAKENIMKTWGVFKLKEWFYRKAIAFVVHTSIACIFLLAIPYPSYKFYYLVNANICLFLMLAFACTLLPALYKRLNLAQSDQNTNEENSCNWAAPEVSNRGDKTWRTEDISREFS